MPDYCGLWEGLESLARLYLIKQLDLAACHQEARTCSAERGLVHRDQKWQEHNDLFWNYARLFAYRFLVLVDAWKLLCAQLQIDPDMLIRDLPGYDTLCRQEEAMRSIAFSAEEALHFQNATEEPAKEGIPQEPGRNLRVDTAEEVVACWREMLAEWAKTWM